MNKEIRKIRKLLGDRFHLCVKYDDNVEPSEWHLFRRYGDAKVYFSKDNGEIMSSETNTLEDLMEFAKKHHKIDEHKAICELIIGIIYIAFIVIMLNIFLWNSNVIRVIVLTIDLICIIINIFSHIIWNKNWKVDMYELDENYKQTLKEIEEKLNGLGNKKSNKRRISKRVGKPSNSRRDS